MEISYEIVYSKDRKNIIDSEQYSEYGFQDDYEAACIKVIYEGDKISYKDKFIKADLWVDVLDQDYENKAIEKRKSND